MKCLYIYSSIETKIGTTGESKKAIMQVESLNELGVETKLIPNLINDKYSKLKIRLPFYPIYPSSFMKKVLEEVGVIDLVYVRRHIIDYSLIKLFKSIKQKNQKVKIILEIPSYPYLQEINRFIDRPLKLKELKNTKHLYKYVDKIVTYTKDTEIFNIKTVMISNGIKTNKILPMDPTVIKKNTLIMTGVALLAYWHGYDRIIEGLANYYKSESVVNVYFYVVGEGSELNNLKKLTKELNLEKYVIFMGAKFNEELDDIYNKSDIAIGCLGTHRKGIKEASSLKLREYCAKGLPFVKSEIDISFSDDFKYMLTVPANDDPINIVDIITFSKTLLLNESKIEVIEKMRIYAKEELDWNIQMNKVLESVLVR